MDYFSKLKEVSGRVKIDIIFSAPRSGSTIFERALTEGYDHQSHEPFYKSSFDEGCGRILSHIHPETRSIVIKAMGRTLQDKDLKSLINISDNVVFCIRDPNYTFASAYKVESLRRPNLPQKDVIDNIVQRSGWRALNKAYNMAEIAEKQFSVVDFTMLCVKPKETMELLCEQLGVSFTTNMIDGFSKTKNLENWQYNEKVRLLPVNGKPLGDDTNGPNDPWMKNARAAESFHMPKKWRISPLPKELIPHLDNEFGPMYKKMMCSKNIMKGSLEEFRDYLNPLIANESKLQSYDWVNSIGDRTGAFRG